LFIFAGPSIAFMKKLWLLLTLVVIVASEVAVLSSFHIVNTNNVSTSTWASDSTLVVISKADYAHLRVEIEIVPPVPMGQSQTMLIFPNGTQIEIPAAEHYTFSVVLPSRGLSPGSFGIQCEGINISDNHPIDVELLSNSTVFQNLYSTIDWTVPPYSRISVYWFLIQGNALVNIQGHGVGL
jgi:hypothetical protein